MRNFTNYITRYVFSGLIMVLSLGAVAQYVPAAIGTDITGTYNDTTLTQYGLFGQYRTYVANNAASGVRKLEFPIAVGVFSTVWRAYTSGQVLSGFNQIIDTTQSASALYNSGSGGQGILLPAVTGGFYYTFNVQNHANGSTFNDTMAILQTAYNPVAIDSVSIPVDTNTINPACSPTITATLAAPPSVGEYVYLRYSITGFQDASMVILMTVSGNQATANIPPYPAGTQVQYYVLTSNNPSLLASGAASAYYDCQTLNLKAGSIGNNFRYTVKTLPVPSVLVSVSSNPVCQGSSAVFTANGFNNGTVASDYQWYKNGTAVGTNDSVYTDPALNNGDSVWVVMTANLGCPVMDTSSHILMTVNPTPDPVGRDTSVCPGSTVDLSTLVTGATNALIYRDDSLSGPSLSNPITANNTDTYVILDSTTATGCYATTTVTVSMLPVTYDSVYVIASELTYCNNVGMDTFIAVPVGGGPSPTYSWTISENPVTTGVSPSGDTLITPAGNGIAGDWIQVTMNSSAACPAQAQPQCNPFYITLNTNSGYTQNDTICQNSSFTENGHTYTATNTYTDTFYNASVTGCDSIVTTNLTVLPLATYTQYDTICQNTSFAENGNNYTASGIYIDTFYNAGVNGCDSVVTTNLTVLPLATYTQSPIICQGSSFTENGNIYTTTNTYIDTFYNAGVNGCDSIVTTNLTVLPYATFAQSPSICAGDSFVENGNSYTTSNTYTDTFYNAAVSGCDSIVTTILTVIPPATFTQSPNICQGASFVENGHTYTTSNTYLDTFFNASVTGCDSIVTTILTVNPAATYTQSPSICQGDSFVENGHTYTVANTYLDTFVNGSVTGCDSIVTTNLTVNPIATYTQNPSICQGGSFAENGHTYTATNTYTDTFYNASVTGCDSIVTTNLTVNPVATYTQNPTICQGSSFTENGNTYTTTNTYTDTFYNASVNGCDSIVTTNLTVLPFATYTQSPSICAGGSFVENGNTYTTSNTYTDTFYNAAVNGCDSIVTTILTVNLPVSYTQFDTICQNSSFTENGHTYTTSNTYMDTFYNASVTGCDSVVITNLTVNPLANFTQFDTICQNSSFTENGHNYTVAGTYVDTFYNASVTGCDSIVTTNLALKPLAAYTQYESICMGGTFVEGTSTYNTTGVYIDTFYNAAVNGCDSIVTTYLVVDSMPYGTASANPSAICLGDTSISIAVTNADTVAGFSGPFAPVNAMWQYGCLLTGYAPAHLYVGAFAGSCDSSGYSIAIAQSGVLTFNWTGTDLDPYLGSSPYYEINGVIYDLPGVDTSAFANSVQNGTVSIPVAAGDVFTFYVQDPSGFGPEVDFSGLVFTASSDSVSWYTAASGGTLLGTGGSLMVVPAGSGSETVYAQITAPGGCTDAGRIPVTITVTPPPTYTQNLSICQGSSIVVNGHTYTTSNTYIDTLKNASVTGCDSVVTTNLTVNPLPVNTIGTGPISQCGGNIILDAGNAPGSSYLWSNGSTAELDTFSSSGEISVVITNSFNCTDTFSRTAFINAAPVVNLGPTQNLCADSTILDAGNPGEQYQWTGGSSGQFLTVYASGSYTVTVTDTATHCSSASSVQVNLGNAPVVTLGNDTALCGGTFTLSAPSGSYTYLWSNGDTTSQIMVSSTGAYSVTVTAGGGCTSTGSTLVTIYNRPDLGADITDSICPYTTADLYNYYINSGLTLAYSTPTPASVDTGTYTVIGTNSNGCSDTAYITIIYRQKPNAGGNKTDSVCPGFTYDLTLLYPNTGYTTYVWNTPDPTAVDTGTYTLIVSNASGCTDTAIATIINSIPPNPGGNKTDSICKGYFFNLLTLYPDSGYKSYAWTNVVNDSAVSPGVYQLVVGNSLGCTDTVYATILQKMQPVVTIPAYPNLCSTNPAFALTGGAPSGGIYSVDYTADSIFNTPVLGPGVHHVLYVYTNASGCTDSASVNVTIYPQPQIIDTVGLPVSCTSSPLIDLNNYFGPPGGQFIGAGVSGYYFYPSLAAAGQDSITYIYTDQNGCMDTAGRWIEILQAVKVSLHTDQSSLTICSGQSITFTASGAIDYQFFVNDSAWTDMSDTNTFTTSALANHDQVSVVGTNGCSTDTSEYIIIDVIPPPTVMVGPDTTIALGQTVQLYSVANGASSLIYLWSPDSSLNLTNVPNPVYSGADTIVLQLRVTDSYGCTSVAYDTINVYIPDNILLPNVITPNGDGKNDVWALNPKIDLTGSHLVIFDRWGVVVYEVYNYNNDWGGTYKSTGQKVPDGTYYYVLTVPAQDNHTYKGPINVLSSEGN